MTVQFEINKELIEALFIASGMPAGKFAIAIGASSKALRMYRDGAYLPKTPEIIANIQKLAHKFGMAPVIVNPSPVEPPSDSAILEVAVSEQAKVHADDDREFSAKNLRAFEVRMGFNGRQAAEYIGVTESLYYKWRAGIVYPKKKSVLPVLRKAMAGNPVKSAKKKKKTPTQTNLTVEAQLKGSKTLIAADRLHEFAKSFRDTYQLRIDETHIDCALTHATNTFGVDRRTLRSILSAVLLVSKDRMTIQELFELISGHS